MDELEQAIEEWGRLTREARAASSVLAEALRASDVADLAASKAYQQVWSLTQAMAGINLIEAM